MMKYDRRPWFVIDVGGHFHNFTNCNNMIFILGPSFQWTLEKKSKRTWNTPNWKNVPLNKKHSPICEKKIIFHNMPFEYTNKFLVGL
jgi:hypothetical protein